MTQELMASILEMSTRAYADLESGKSCCSAETLVLYLHRLCPDAGAFLPASSRGLRRRRETTGKAFLGISDSSILVCRRFLKAQRLYFYAHFQKRTPPGPMDR